ncbi:MAG: hypothetical protein V8S22_03390 [Lachnospiraceae bacterium]
MHFDKKDIEIYLQGVWAAIDAEKYQFAPRHKNRELLTDYVISEEMELDIIKSLTPMDFSTAVPNDHKGMEHEILYIFGKDIDLLERFGDKERTVSLYIKFNKISDQYLFVISFHEQEHPLSYYFK